MATVKRVTWSYKKTTITGELVEPDKVTCLGCKHHFYPGSKRFRFCPGCGNRLKQPRTRKSKLKAKYKADRRAEQGIGWEPYTDGLLFWRIYELYQFDAARGPEWVYMWTYSGDGIGVVEGALSAYRELVAGKNPRVLPAPGYRLVLVKHDGEQVVAKEYRRPPAKTKGGR